MQENQDVPLHVHLGDAIPEQMKEKLEEAVVSEDLKAPAYDRNSLFMRAAGIVWDSAELGLDVIEKLPIPGRRLFARSVRRLLGLGKTPAAEPRQRKAA